MKRIIIIAAIILAGVSTSAQGLSIDTLFTGTPYTTQFNATFPLTFEVSVVDTAGIPLTYTGFVNFFYLTDSMQASQQQPLLFDTATVQVDTNNTSFVFNSAITIIPQHFHSGGNIIIVWPTSVDNTPTYDSVTFVLTIDGFFSLQQEQPDRLFAFPNPADQQFTLQSKQGNFKEITVYTADGRIMSVKQYEGIQEIAVVDVAAYPPGNYIVQVTFQDGSGKRITLIKP